MKEIEIKTTVRELELNEVSSDIRQLIYAARDATYRAYAPYSHFRVGAAILLDDGTVVTGSNQENVAYPSGLCAERTAAYYAHSAHPDRRMVAIAIAARGINEEFVTEPISPCGACRQALIEYEKLAGDNIKVYLVGANHIYEVESIHALLPLTFSISK